MKVFVKSRTCFVFLCLIATIYYQSPIQAVTDAELEALEKQLEQQEMEAKRNSQEEQRTETETKKRLADEEMKRRLEEQNKKLIEQRRVEEENKKAEEARLIDVKRQQEEKKKIKYNLVIKEAEQAVANKDKSLALEKFNEALALNPDDLAAKTGINKAEKLMDNICYKFVGVWYWNSGAVTRFYEDGKVNSSTSIRFIKSDGYWECSDPDNKSITFDTWGNKRKVTLLEENQIESIDAILGTKITAKKVSNNPFEKITPNQNSNINIPKL